MSNESRDEQRRSLLLLLVKLRAQFSQCAVAKHGFDLTLVDQKDLLLSAWYLRELGLLPDAVYLLKTFRVLFFRASDEMFAKLAKGERPEFRQWLIEQFGNFPLPTGDKKADAKETKRRMEMLRVQAFRLESHIEELIGRLKPKSIGCANNGPSFDNENSERDDFEKQAKSIPALDCESDDWINNRAAGRLLGVDTETLANHRIKGIKSGTKDYGLHDGYCFWRKQGHQHPRYYLPLMKKHSGQLVKIFRKADLNRH